MPFASRTSGSRWMPGARVRVVQVDDRVALRRPARRSRGIHRGCSGCCPVCVSRTPSRMPRARIAVGLRPELALQRVDPRRVQLLERAPRRAPQGAIDGERDHLPAVVVDERADRLLAVRLGDPAHEVRAVQVLQVPLRPAADRVRVRHHVERRDVVLEDVGAHPHVPHRRAEPSAARLGRLLVDREPLEQPPRRDLVRRELLADDEVRERGETARVIDVQDVRELVGDELEVPVVHVAERREVVRRGDVEGDRVVREHRRRAVGRVRLVGEDDLGPLDRRPADGGLEARVDVLAEVGDVLATGCFARVVRDAEVRRLDRVPGERSGWLGGARARLAWSTTRARARSERADAGEESTCSHGGPEGPRSTTCAPPPARHGFGTSGSVSRERRVARGRGGDGERFSVAGRSRRARRGRA